jgi:3-hydroxyacyl-[acyl-carrier-protein] dehydratase
VSSLLPKPIDILPQQPPFLFVDEYLELDENHCLARYTFKKDEWFFKGHFPGKPVVPGVILIEAMAQVGVSIAFFITAKAENIPIEKAKESGLTLFVKVGEIGFLGMVFPEETVFIHSKIIFSRFGKFETEGEIYKLVEGEEKIVCTHKSLIGRRVKMRKAA